MVFANRFTVEDKINALERWILVQSYIYYELNDNVVADEIYNVDTQQLLELRERYPDTFESSRYYPYFYDFESGTGFNLIDRVKKQDSNLYLRIVEDASIALDLYKRKGA